MKQRKSKEKVYQITNRENKIDGITLVALVVTIVVLLILAGITITYVMGDNSIFNQASKSKIHTEIAKVEEQAGTIYSSKLLQKVKDNLKDKPTMQEVVGELRNEGHTIEQIAVNANAVTGISLDKENLILEYRKNGTIQITLDGKKDEEIYEYYVLINEKYYKMHFNDGAVSIDRTESDISNSDDNTTATLTVSSENESIATATVDSNTNVMTVTSKSVAGTAKITITYGEYTKECNIKVVAALATSISLNENSYVVTGGYSWKEELTLKATVKPYNAEQVVTWKSSDESIATVDSNGLVKAVDTGKGGDITITATTTDGTDLSAECAITVEIFSEVKQGKTNYNDKEGNTAVIPGGFAVGTSDNINKVTGGLVIQDNEGNQFVWIPVGNFKGKNGEVDSITLGRYSFDKTNGTPKLEQNADNYTQEVFVEMLFKELVTSTSNTPAKSLKNFTTKTKSNGGYYLGRYEASKGTDGKADSQFNKTQWKNITQPDAATAARGMYNSSYVESDLINSYSWDTAIVFIQKCSENSNYSNKQTETTSVLKTGRTVDKICNIYDMSESYQEYTTEFSTGSGIYEGSSVTRRGGGSLTNHYETAHRSYNFPETAHPNAAFRLLLYLK